MTDLSVIQSWPRDVLERAFTHREDELAKAREAENLARAGFDKAAAERNSLEKQFAKSKITQHAGDCHWWTYKVCDCGYLMRANSHDFGEPSSEIIQAFLEHSHRICNYKSPEEVAAIVADRDNAVKCLQENFKGVVAIRCMKHFRVPPYNRNEICGGECPVCEIEKLETQLTAHTQALKVAKDKLEFLRHEIDYGTSEELKRAASAIQPILATINNLLK